MVRRRSTVRFRNGAPAQSDNSNQHNVPVGTNGLPRWKISTVLGGDQDSRCTASAWQSRRRRCGATVYRVTPGDHRSPGPWSGDPISVDAGHVRTWFPARLHNPVPVRQRPLCAAARGRFAGPRRLRLRRQALAGSCGQARLGTIAAWPMTTISPLGSGT